MFDPGEVQKFTGNFDDINLDEIDITVEVIKTDGEESSESGENGDSDDSDSSLDIYLEKRKSDDSMYVHDGKSTPDQEEGHLAVVKTRCDCCRKCCSIS